MLNRFSRAFVFKKKILSSKRILEKNFSTNKVFEFVQVGANDGISFDFLYDFIITRESKGIVIEPIVDYFNDLVKNYKNYKNVEPVNMAIHPNLKKVIIFKISENSKFKYPDWVKGIASFDSNHHIKLKIDSKDIIEEEVNCDTLSNVIKAYYKPKKIDYLQIDTEGFDYEILKMIDFKNIYPKMIKFESINLTSENKSNAIQLLHSKGYYLFEEFGDTIGIRLNKINLI